MLKYKVFLIIFLLITFNSFASLLPKELIKAQTQVPPYQSEGLNFLIENMPPKDRRQLSAEFLLENLQYAYQAINEVPWGSQIPEDIFLNYVLPYASVDERRDRWRKDFYERYINQTKDSKSIEELALKLNKQIYKDFNVSYNPDKRPKANQSPYETIKVGYASCTGLSILLVDVLRSVGIPARLAGIEMWPDGSGNHTWVEIWDGQWKYLGASESSKLNEAWFSQKAAQIDLVKDEHIYAVSFKKTNQCFPMRWAKRNKSISAVDVTSTYKS